MPAEKFSQHSTVESQACGRDLDQEGNVTGDEVFHRVHMSTTSEQEQEDLKSAEKEKIALAEHQADSFIEVDRIAAIQAYEGLLSLFPRDARTSIWKEKLLTLRGNQ